MKINLASDLHLEIAPLTMINSDGANVLVLSGDILTASVLARYPDNGTNAVADRYRDFMRQCADQWQHVVAISGNHEFYGGKWGASHKILYDEYARCGIKYLQNSVEVIDGVLFIGATLWTDLNRGNPLTALEVRTTMNDYHKITHDINGYRKLRPEDTSIDHARSLRYIMDTVAANPGVPTVVIGHHPPSFNSVHPMYRTAGNAGINYAYHSNLDGYIVDTPQIKLWTCGHVHHRHHYYVGDTLVAAAPRGYLGFEPQAETFQVGLIDLDNMPSQAQVAADPYWEK